MRGGSITCPRCGKYANLQSGTYQFRDDITTFFSSSRLSQEELTKLSEIIEKAQKEKTTASEIRSILDREVPRAAGLKKFITDGVNLPFVIATILAALMWYFPRSVPCEPAATLPVAEPARGQLCPRMLLVPSRQSDQFGVTGQRHRHASRIRIQSSMLDCMRNSFPETPNQIARFRYFS
ncbi:MAG: hypothetical protein WBD27_18985 [Pyrinomonadaceae bacterium]